MRSNLTWTCVVGFAWVAGAASVLAVPENASTNGNPYSVISDRNVFHLNPLPPPEPPPEPKPLDLPKVMLTGFVGKGSSMKVYLAIPPAKDSKEGTFYTSGLLPGDKEHDVELVKINYAHQEVEIINGGTPQTLSVKSNSYLATASAPAGGKGGGAPGMPGNIGLRHGPPGFPPRNIPQPSAPPTAATFGGGGSPIVAGGGGSGSAIVAGGGGSSGSAFNSFGSSSGTIVSGGTPYSGGVPASGNNVGNQLATSLFNPQTGRYQSPSPIPAGPPAPIAVQAANMIIQEAAGGPPSPIHADDQPPSPQ